MSYKMGIVAILALFVLIFLAQNTEVVKVSFLFWDISMSRAVLLFFSLSIGFFLGWFLHSFLLYRKKKNNPQKY
jgi:lipopolysaccharide assembly protein A